MNKFYHKIYLGFFFITGIALTVYIGVNGYRYYSTPLEERVFLTGHSLLKPSGALGHGYGIVGTLLMFIGVVVYMIRKRVKYFAGLGYLKYWLEFHIYLCTIGPILVLFHTAFKFGGIVAVSFWSMAAVVLSGAVGRFIYVQIPRSITGNEMSLKELDAINLDLHNKIVSLNPAVQNKIENASSPQKYFNISFMKSLELIWQDFILRKKILSEIKKELRVHSDDRKKIKETLNAVSQKLVISRRIGMLKIMHKVFRYWHIIHLPFAVAMFIIMIIHVIVTLSFGYKWIF